MFLASKASEVAAENNIIGTISFTAGCCWLLAMFFSEGMRKWQRMIAPGGNVTMILLSLALIGISVYVLH